MIYTLGADISKWQDDNSTPQKPNLQRLWDAGYRFLSIRVAQGKSIEDEDWKYYWAEAKRIGFLRFAYQLIEHWKPIQEQAEFFWDKIKDDPGELPPAADYERPNQNFPDLPAREDALIMLEKWFDYIDPRYGKPSVLYCNTSTLLYNLRPSKTSGAFLWAHPLWISQPLYKLDESGKLFQPLQHCHNLEELGNRKPSYIDKWDKWTYWQWTFQLPGLKLGMESKQFDGDLFNGSYEDLQKFAGIQPQKPELTDKEKLDWLWNKYGIPA